MLAFVMIFLLVPETKQRTLEELDYVFAVPLRKFIAYQVREVLPWWVRRFVFQDKTATVRELYKFDRGISGDDVHEATPAKAAPASTTPPPATKGEVGAI